MKAYLAFDLPEDQTDFEFAQKGLDWACLATEISRWLRDKLKYGHDFKSADEALETLRTHFYHELEARGLDPDMV